MKLNSLNNIIDDILLTARNNNISESEHLSRILIELWIANYRALLILQDLNKGRDINPMYIQTLKCVHLDRIEDVPGHFLYVTNVTLPKLIDFNFRTGLIAVKDMFGNLILIGSETKMKYLRNRKYTCGDYIAYLRGNKVYVEGGNNTLEWIQLDIVAENPADLLECFDPDGEYPIPAHMIPTIKNLIFTKELNIQIHMPSDDSNNSRDDLLNLTSSTNGR